MAVASAKHGQRVGGPRVLMLLVHALSDDEQQAHFSKMPWFVRKLLLKRIWAGSFRGCLKGRLPGNRDLDQARAATGMNRGT